MKVLTRKQREALKRVYCRARNCDHPIELSYREFRKTVQYAIHDDCIMVFWAGMWLGIETDGYTHS